MTWNCIIDGAKYERYRMIQQHLAMYDTGSEATVSQEKFVVLCSQISWTWYDPTFDETVSADQGRVVVCLADVTL